MNNLKDKTEILLIEDDLPTCKSIKKQLGLLGFSVYVEYRGDHGLNSLVKNVDSLDLAIIDIHLPMKNGLDICHEARMNGVDLPIIILTQETAGEIAVSAFDVGANDFMRKPFDIDELKARIGSVLKFKSSNSENTIATRHLKIDLNRRVVFHGRKELELRRKEFDLIVFLSRNPDKVLSRDQLISNVWGFDEEPYPNTVDAHVSILRKKLCDEKQMIIETIFGIGYRFRG